MAKKKTKRQRVIQPMYCRCGAMLLGEESRVNGQCDDCYIRMVKKSKEDKMVAENIDICEARDDNPPWFPAPAGGKGKSYFELRPNKPRRK